MTSKFTPIMTHFLPQGHISFCHALRGPFSFKAPQTVIGLYKGLMQETLLSTQRCPLPPALDSTKEDVSQILDVINVRYPENLGIGESQEFAGEIFRYQHIRKDTTEGMVRSDRE